MAACYLRILFISILILHSTGQTVFHCPKPVAYGDSANLTCSNLQSLVSINNPAGIQVGGCTNGTCASEDGSGDKISITLSEDTTLLLTVHEIDKTDEGEWTCQSGKTDKCSLNVYKLPSCEISSTNSTNDLSLGQDLTLNINLTDYYCTKSIVWNLTIGGQSLNVAGFRDREEIENISSRIVTYSTSSLTGRVQLTFNCNDETYDVSCSGVKELQLRDPPSFNLTSHDDTDDLTIGNNLTLQADIEEYPCTTGIKYALVSGSVMVAAFAGNSAIFHATFEVKPEYLDKQLHLKYTCNSVSATTRTQRGVTILRIKDDVQSTGRLTETEWIIIYVAIALVVIVIVIITVIVICRFKRKKTSLNNDPPYSDAIDTLPGRKNSLNVTSNNMYTKVSDVNGSLKKHHFEADDVNGNPKGGLSETGDGNLNDKSRQRSVCEMVPNTAYESVDVIRLELKEKQKGNNLKCPEAMYAKVDKQRSQRNGVPDLVASAKM